MTYEFKQLNMPLTTVLYCPNLLTPGSTGHGSKL